MASLPLLGARAILRGGGADAGCRLGRGVLQHLTLVCLVPCVPFLIKPYYETELLYSYRGSDGSKDGFALFFIKFVFDCQAVAILYRTVRIVSTGQPAGGTDENGGAEVRKD